MSQPDYVRFRDSAKSLQSLAAYRTLSVTLGGAEAGTLRGGLISCNLFDVIRPGPPVAGRYLTSDECADADADRRCRSESRPPGARDSTPIREWSAGSSI